MRLKFGDEKSIALRDKMIAENAINKLLKIIKCPFCGARPTNCYEHDITTNEFCFNFDCREDCPNSAEYCEKNGDYEIKTCCDSEGKFYN